MSDRNEIRGKIFAGVNKIAKGKELPFFGQVIEVRQPTVGQIETLMSDGEGMNLIEILLQYVYVPGTNELMFEEADRETLRGMPFTTEGATIVQTLEDYLGLKVTEAEKN